MKSLNTRKLITTMIVAAMSGTAMGQTAINAYETSQSDLRGTARFVSMAGAFTALGGDLSTLNQNPGGIGMYRKSDIGITMNIDAQHTRAGSDPYVMTTNRTSVTVPNVGYVGVVNFGQGAALQSFQWGISYGRQASFNRRYHGVMPDIRGSLTNREAEYAATAMDGGGGIPTGRLQGWGSYDPFFDSDGNGAAVYGYDVPWLSILMYNAYGINPSNPNSTDYQGLYNGTPGTAEVTVDESGYIDEYSINFGGNVKNLVYWGIGLGITDLSYDNHTYYTEQFNDATISNPTADGLTTGSANIGLDTWSRISGTGVNLKLGVIVRPVNALRIGVAVHTPTWYNMSYDASSYMNYDYQYTRVPDQRPLTGTYPNRDTYSADNYFTYRMRTPWRMMVGVAGVIGTKAIISADYEYRAMDKMHLGSRWGYSMIDQNSDISRYYTGQNILRVGVEYRPIPYFSLRAGYSYMSSGINNDMRSGAAKIYTSGPSMSEVRPSYMLEGDTNYATFGLGWSKGSFYANAAVVMKFRTSEWMPYGPYTEGSPSKSVTPESMKVSETDTQVVLSAGFRF